jgi:tellurite resistance protein TerC
VNTPAWVWAATLTGVALLLAIDLFVIGRRPHEPSTKEAAWWVTFYIALAAAFGVGVWVLAGHDYGGQFFSGWITEYSMSVDNLFVFMLIMASFSVPRQFQQKVLMVGIITALILRGVFIAIGAELVERFVWVFFIFGAFLIFTAIQLLRNGDDDEEFKENVIIRWSRRLMPVSRGYNKGKIFTRENGRRMVTPMLIVMIAIGTTDLLFAVDSIPATFGLTQEGFLVFTVNVFALMGLRQLYFLLGGLLERLVYLTYGLAAILGFIGVKLVLHALAHNDVPFLNGGQPMPQVPEVNTWVSLGVIVGILVLATVASLLFPPRKSSHVADVAAQAEDADGRDGSETDSYKSTGAVHHLR